MHVIQPSNLSVGLSVSPIGSSPLQHLAGQQCDVGIKAFSIPNRIEPSATKAKAEQLRAQVESFSIPNRIEPSATPARPHFLPLAVSFSIPNRIEPSATW